MTRRKLRVILGTTFHFNCKNMHLGIMCGEREVLEAPPFTLDTKAVGGLIMSELQVTQSLAYSQEYSSLTKEVWRPVPSKPGVLASSKGRILQPPRYAPMNNGGFRAYMPKPRYGQISREHKAAKHTYRIIMIRCEQATAKQKPRKVHQLVCEAFHGPKPFDGAVVLHLDEDAHNNRPDNLRWGTQKENMNADGFIAYCKSRKRNS